MPKVHPQLKNRLRNGLVAQLRNRHETRRFRWHNQGHGAISLAKLSLFKSADLPLVIRLAKDAEKNVRKPPEDDLKRRQVYTYERDCHSVVKVAVAPFSAVSGPSLPKRFMGDDGLVEVMGGCPVHEKRCRNTFQRRKQAMTTVFESFQSMKNVRMSVATSSRVRILLPATETRTTRNLSRIDNNPSLYRRIGETFYVEINKKNDMNSFERSAHEMLPTYIKCTQKP